MAAIFSPSRFILSSVPSDTGGRVESRCSRCVYTPAPRNSLDRTVPQRVVVHPALFHTADGSHQLVVIGLVLYGIYARRVDYQERRAVVFVEKARVGVVE